MLQGRVGALREEPRRTYVHIHQPVPALECQLVERPGSGDTRVADHRIQTVERRTRTLDERRHRSRLTQIGGHDLHLRSVSLEPSAYRLEIIRKRPIRQYELSAAPAARDGFGNGCTNTSAGASDKDLHRSIPPSVLNSRRGGHTNAHR